MVQSLSIGIVGDYSDTIIAHKAIPLALTKAAAALGLTIKLVWLETASLSSDRIDCDAIWLAPGSPYVDADRVLEVIRTAREQQLPLMGTCGGCQHMLLEWARNVLGWKDATHAEFETGGRQVIRSLVCSLINVKQEIRLKPMTHLYSAYAGQNAIQATYQCSFGINPEYSEVLFMTGELVVNAENAEGEPRGFELTTHPFYVATMFQPERDALEGSPVPLADALLAAAAARKPRYS
ncbi:CTP synthase C-terminal region-related (seleno)protein [Cernens ardua]|uniref:CTP synthase C-terminal region-related (seleno)protein n=1 Tax=Cernens ardua TaxID=3402176 RepID=UPI003F960DA1